MVSDEKKPYLVISDLQMPFEHEKALEFCRYLKRHFNIPENHVYNLGDETDQYYGGLWKKDINARHTALSEISETKERLKPWYDAFPVMRLCTSNHGTRWQRKALEADIPEILTRRYEEVLGCPKTWLWADRWIVNSKYRWMGEHGDSYGGGYPHIQAAMHNGISTAIGHHHSKVAITHLRTRGQTIWGAVLGSLIKFDEYAFKYGWKSKLLPLIGTGIVFDEGKYINWYPLE